MKGRPPVPTALKILRGNPGRRPLNNLEPKPRVGAEMPGALLNDPLAVAHWTREGEKLTRLGVLTEVDARCFARLCRLWADEDRTSALQSETGLPLGCDPRTLAEIRQLEERFGMNPSSRVKLKVERPKPETKLEGFRGRAG